MIFIPTFICLSEVDSIAVSLFTNSEFMSREMAMLSSQKEEVQDLSAKSGLFLDNFLNFSGLCVIIVLVKIIHSENIDPVSLREQIHGNRKHVNLAPLQNLSFGLKVAEICSEIIAISYFCCEITTFKTRRENQDFFRINLALQS